MRAVICRKATFTVSVSAVILPDANSLSSRAQNRGFCALLPSGTHIFGHFEHKIGVFVRFLPSGPPISGISSTKSRFLCVFCLRNPHFRAFRAQNRHFCVRMGDFSGILGVSSTKSGFLCSEMCAVSCAWIFVSELRYLKRCVSGCCI